MNIVLLTGRLTKDPELRYVANSQTAVCKFNLAVDRPVKVGKEKEADFPRITVFGKQAENCEKYLAKGRMVGVQGRLQTGSYKNREGVTVYTTDVIADRVEFLEWGDQGGNRAKRNEERPTSDYREAEPDEEMPDSFQAIDEDVPF